MLKYISLKNFTSTPPAIYVFGDSSVEAGNNNFLYTIVKANYIPYGVDFGGLPPTGRFTNGRTGADFIAQVVGLPFPPAVLSLSRAEKKTILTGLNFASSAAGILPMPPRAKPLFGQILSLEEQVRKFKKAAADLKHEFDSHESFALYMAKSLFFVDIGTNDLSSYWEFGQKDKFKNATNQYALLLQENLSRRLKKMTDVAHFGWTTCSGAWALTDINAKVKDCQILKIQEKIHQLGARKFLVNNLSPLGCVPSNINTSPHETPCVEEINRRVWFYNGVLPNMLARLEASLKGSTFVLCDLYKVYEDVYAQPAAYGFTNVNASCCIDVSGNNTRECARGLPPCSDRTGHVFFDSFHATESVNFLWTRRILKDDSICSPFSLFKLIQL